MKASDLWSDHNIPVVTQEDLAFVIDPIVLQISLESLDRVRIPFTRVPFGRATMGQQGHGEVSYSREQINTCLSCRLSKTKTFLSLSSSEDEFLLPDGVTWLAIPAKTSKHIPLLPPVTDQKNGDITWPHRIEEACRCDCAEVFARLPCKTLKLNPNAQDSGRQRQTARSPKYFSFTFLPKSVRHRVTVWERNQVSSICTQD